MSPSRSASSPALSPSSEPPRARGAPARHYMEMTASERHRVERALRRVHGLAFWLDDAFEIPWLERRVGLDPLIGLIPGAGDWTTWGLSVYIFFEAVRLELPVRLLVRVAYNIALDLVIGVVPLVGDLADAAVKANKKNARLLVEHCAAEVDGATIRFTGDPLARARSTPLGRWTTAVVVVVVLLALLALPIALIAWLLSLGRA